MILIYTLYLLLNCLTWVNTSVSLRFPQNLEHRPFALIKVDSSVLQSPYHSPWGMKGKGPDILLALMLLNSSYIQLA